MTSHVIIRDNPISSPDNLIFEALSKFVHAKSIEFYENNITEIPSNVFQNIVGKQDQLETLILSDFCHSRPSSLRNLGNNAFSQLKSLKTFIISYSLIDFIPENAFEFNEVSETRLTIDLIGNQYLNNSGFSELSLTKLKRPTTIILSSTIFSYLDQKIFQPFLRSNVKNLILLYGTLNCKD